MISAFQAVSAWAVPLMILGILALGMARRLPAYEIFVEGAKEGFTTAVSIIPFLVAMFVAISVFRESGAMELLLQTLRPLTKALGVPSEVMPLALLRPLSGSASFGLTSYLIKSHGPDSLIGRLASAIQGSTETTFYVLTVYFGAVGVKKTRYALPVGLIADLAGFLAAVFITRVVFG